MWQEVLILCCIATNESMCGKHCSCLTLIFKILHITVLSIRARLYTMCATL